MNTERSKHQPGLRFAPPLSPSSPGDSRGFLHAWRKRHGTIGTLPGYSASPATKTIEIPPDNIFVPIQADDILPQIPISNHHPCPRMGIEDNDLRTLHTNSFYAGAFLGSQQYPIWTHPYAIWWGRGIQDTDILQTWGMNVMQADKDDYHYERGAPPKVRRSRKAKELI